MCRIVSTINWCVFGVFLEASNSFVFCVCTTHEGSELRLAHIAGIRCGCGCVCDDHSPDLRHPNLGKLYRDIYLIKKTSRAASSLLFK
jgi:hypothetical protein